MAIKVHRIFKVNFMEQETKSPRDAKQVTLRCRPNALLMADGAIFKLICIYMVARPTVLHDYDNVEPKILSL